MNQPQAAAESIVVGIDGSNTAISTAKWAVPEATSRDTPLRLVYVTHSDDVASPTDGLDVDLEYAETALRTAAAAVHAMGQSVKVETVIVHGSPENALIDESRTAAMVCVGSVGIGRIARMLLGSTAVALAHKACCPVAIIRPDHVVSDSGWVAVVVNDAPDNNAVLDHGFREARLRDASILAMGTWRWGLGEIPYTQLNRRLGPWLARYPEMHVYPAAARSGAAEFLAHTLEPVQLAVVGSAESGEITRIVGPGAHSLLGRAAFSVLLVRR